MNDVLFWWRTLWQGIALQTGFYIARYHEWLDLPTEDAMRICLKIDRVLAAVALLPYPPSDR
jgi:hypothetical protein